MLYKRKVFFNKMNLYLIHENYVLFFKKKLYKQNIHNLYVFRSCHTTKLILFVQIRKMRR